MDTFSDLQICRSPAAQRGDAAGTGRLGEFQPPAKQRVVTHYNILPTADIYTTTQDRDLGAVAHDIQKVVNANRKTLPRGSTV